GGLPRFATFAASFIASLAPPSRPRLAKAFNEAPDIAVVCGPRWLRPVSRLRRALPGGKRGFRTGPRGDRPSSFGPPHRVGGPPKPCGQPPLGLVHRRAATGRRGAADARHQGEPPRYAGPGTSSAQEWLRGAAVRFSGARGEHGPAHHLRLPGGP